MKSLDSEGTISQGIEYSTIFRIHKVHITLDFLFKTKMDKTVRPIWWKAIALQMAFRVHPKLVFSTSWASSAVGGRSTQGAQERTEASCDEPCRSPCADEAVLGEQCLQLS